MRIHFICTGNICRSRLAQAYCASRCGPEVQVHSSGIAAGLHSNIPISSYAAGILARHALTRHTAPHWQRTTEALVRSSDVLVFMETEHLRFCRPWIEPARQKIEVWEIEDIGPIKPVEIPNRAARTFAIVRRRTDLLLAALGLGNNQPAL